MAVVENSPKKRGRPRKNPVVEEKPKGKRGRPIGSGKNNPNNVQLVERKRTPKPVPQGNKVFALDIGTRTIVGILAEHVGDNFSIIDMEVAEHPKRAMIDGQIEDITQVSLMVSSVKKTLEKRNNIILENVSIAAAGRALRTINTSLTFDVHDREAISNDLVKSMEIEAVQKAQEIIDENRVDNNMKFYCVGHTVVQLYLDDYKMQTIEGHKGSKAKVEVIAAFLPDVVLESLYTVMDNNNLHISSLTLEPIAAMNVVIPPEIRLINIALVDIGAGTSDIAISRDGSIVAYGMATTAGDEITEEVIRNFLVDFNTAERMKLESQNGDIVFQDIFGVTSQITGDEFNKRIYPATEALANAISKEILHANGKAVQAIFLVGGGSKLHGLSNLIAEKLGMDPNRVAVGSQSFIKHVTIPDKFKLGPEFVTPVGIGVTNGINQGYDFSTIILNNEKVRVFNKKQLTVFELLTLAGVKSTQVLGRSGKNLTFTLNGQKQVVKGSLQTPAQITVNGKEANLNTIVVQGDNVVLIPAKNGEDAHAYVGEYAEPTQSGNVIFCGESYPIGTIVEVNGKPAQQDTVIEAGDIVEIIEIKNLGQLTNRLGIELIGVHYTCGGINVDESYILKDKDNLMIAQGEAFDFTKGKAPTLAEKSLTGNTLENNPEITIRLNGKKIILPPKSDNSPYIFIDLYNLLDFDVRDRGVDLLMILNGLDAKFTDEIHDGDDIIIR